MFLRMPDGDVVDFELDSLRAMSHLLESRLAALLEACDESEDPDGDGLFDDIDFVVGIGFVCCQRYLAATSGAMALTKREAFGFGPRLSCGLGMAEIVNAAADRWKHKDEWANGRRELHPRTRKVLERLPLLAQAPTAERPQVRVDYVNSYILSYLTPSAGLSFADLIANLEAWRDSLPRSR